MDKSRSNSDDWIYTVYRKQIHSTGKENEKKRVRSNSLDWAFPKMKPKKDLDSSPSSDIQYAESNNNAVVINKNNQRTQDPHSLLCGACKIDKAVPVFANLE